MTRPLAAALVLCSAACGLPPGEVCDAVNNPCRAGLSCVQGACRFATCDDGVRNGSESDVDCGGTCPACIAAERCVAASDCTTNNCVNNACECPPGKHASGGGCAANTDVACGAAQTDCTRAFANGTGVCNALAATCTLASCDSSAHVCGGKCASSSSPQSCGTSCAPCPVPANGAATCSGGACGIACGAGYHTFAATCEADTNTTCGAHTTDCTTAYPNGAGACAPSTTSSPASCHLASCDAGFHPSGESCVVQEPTACGSPPVDCTVPPNADPNGTMTCLPGGICGVASCHAGYHINGNRTACIQSTDTCCSSACANCTTAFANGSGVCAISGNAPGGSCIVSGCATGYHADAASNSCVANSNTACGSPPVDCTAIPNGSGTCNGVQGSCSYACNSGYHLNGSACEPNTDTSCGASRINCTQQYPNGTGRCDSSSGNCYLAGCVTSYHACGSSCVSDFDVNTCGTSCTPCPDNDPNGTPYCNGSSCATTCRSGYNDCAGGMCSPDTDAACGRQCDDCTSVDFTCINGQCRCKSRSCLL